MQSATEKQSRRDMRKGELSANLVIESEKVYGNGVLSRVVLLRTGEERLREVESTEPENGWRSFGEPVLRNRN